MKRDAMGTSPFFDFIPSSVLLRLNVGGDIFDVSCDLLTKDPFSVLASLCRTDPPIEPSYEPKMVVRKHRHDVAADSDSENEDGGDDEELIRSYFIDRDGQLFKPILHFLATEQLPTDEALLHQMFVFVS